MNDKINNYNVNQLYGTKKMDNKSVNNEEKSMEDLIIETLKKLSDQEQYVPEYGDFAPVMEFFENPDKRTQDFIGKYGIKIYKMPKDVVPDPKKRYIEAAAYVPSGTYKSDMVVGSGNKEEIFKHLKDPKFVNKLKDVYEKLGEVFEQYD